jgi:hypothetical protein
LLWQIIVSICLPLRRHRDAKRAEHASAAPGNYVDTPLTEDMLPISKGYALSLIDAFLVRHAIGLAAQADNMAGKS